MIYRIRWQWTSYKGNPLATFLSFSYNLSFLVSAVSLFILIFGFIYYDLTTIIIGTGMVIIMIAYFFTVPDYLKSLDKNIELQKQLLEKQKLILQYQECKKKYPSIDFNEEIKNAKFAFLINRLGYSIVDAYEETHLIKKLELHANPLYEIGNDTKLTKGNDQQPGDA